MLNLRPRERAGWRGGGSYGNRLPAGNIRVTQQIVVEVLTVAPEHSGELVDLTLGEIQLGKAVGISAEPAANGPEGIYKRMLLAGECMHLESLAQHSRPGLKIDQRVVHGAAASNAGNAPAQIHGVMDRITNRSAYLCLGRWKWSGRRRNLCNCDAGRQ